VPGLADLFLDAACRRFRMLPKRLSGEVRERLMHHDWARNNVRELRNAIERMIVVADGEMVRLEHLPPDLGPRIDIFALSTDQKYSEIIPEIIKNGYSRIPVYKDSIDTVIGILYVKDLLPYIDRKQFDWTTLMREPFFVPENKKLDDLMVEFQSKKVHLAVVVDEYGGTSVLVSLEDVIEEIVGDISDEYDDDDLVYTKIDDNNYMFEGKTPLKDFYKIINLEDESVFEDKKGEAETIAGFILEVSGIFPRRNSKINFGNYVFTIEAFEQKRIKQVKFTILD
jgi:gliding motility-associated protein GldE